MKTVPDFHDFLDVTRNERTRAVAQLNHFDRSMITWVNRIYRGIQGVQHS